MSFQRIALTSSFLTFVAVASVACSSTSTGSPSSSAAPDSGVAVAFGEPLHLSIKIPSVPPGTEGTKCLRVRLGNDAPLHIGKIHNVLSEASHHFVVSTQEDPSLTEAPLFDCQPFRAPLTGAPLVISQKHDDLTTMPDGVAYTLAASQLMHLELHYINTTGSTTDIEATSDLFPIDGATGDLKEASFLLIGNLDIAIPPHASYSTGPTFQPLPAGYDGVTFYALTGHTHRFGTNVTVGMTASSTASVTPLYAPTPFDWSEPVVKHLSPPVQLPAGGGFSFQCDWYNPTDTTVTFGESALAEMCFFWAYYYPKRDGSRLLLQGLSAVRGADAGPTIAGPPCAAAADAGNELGVGKYCEKGGNQCDGAADFCLADFTKGAFGDFCSKTCNSDSDCGAGASCTSAGSQMAAQTRICIPAACIASLGAMPDSGAP
jgi:hypothetical protein